MKQFIFVVTFFTVFIPNFCHSQQAIKNRLDSLSLQYKRGIITGKQMLGEWNKIADSIYLSDTMQAKAIDGVKQQLMYDLNMKSQIAELNKRLSETSVVLNTTRWIMYGSIILNVVLLILFIRKINIKYKNEKHSQK